MSWYYVSSGQSVGPVAEADFDSLVATGVIKPETLVWQQGMANWRPYSEVRPGQGGPPNIRLAAMEPPASKPSVAASPTIGLVACSQCGKFFAPESLIQIGSSRICAACKPLYIQKLREGVPAAPLVAGAMQYAGFWIRVLAKLLDGIILGGAAVVIVGILAALFLPAVAKNSKQSGVFLVIFIALVALVVLGLWFYQIWCLPKYGGTPGKRILRLRVVTAAGGPISWGRAIGRFFAEMLNGFIPFWIGYIIAAFDSQKRTVHDHICGTRVIKE